VLTLLAQTGAPDEAYARVNEQFEEEEEIVALTPAVGAINGWNRFAVGFRSPVGDYVSPANPGSLTTRSACSEA
jgi:alkylhydroperoxidase family enzyme